MVTIITLIQIGLLLVETLLRFFSFMTALAGAGCGQDMRIAVYFSARNLTQFDTTPIGTLTTRTINDIRSINDIFAEPGTDYRRPSFHRLCAGPMMFAVDVRLTFIALIPFPIMIIATLLFQGKYQQVIFPGPQRGGATQCLLYRST